MGLSLWMGSVGFLCYYVYDIFSIVRPESVARYLFRVGTVFVVISFLYEVYSKASHVDVQTVSFVACFCLMCLFVVALVYTLFFCFDVNETYLQVNQERLAYTEGMYALCRHPGVLWYAGIYMSLYGILRTEQTLWYAAVMIGYNVVYIILQDLWVFPKTFRNYDDYKKTTPFLIPNIGSIKKCRRTLHKRDLK